MIGCGPQEIDTIMAKVQRGESDVSKRERIISAAERLFANKGLHGAGLREIAREAGVNVNLINWHFKSKDALYVQVHELRANEINAMRRDLLAQANERSEPKPPPVREIIYAFIHPFFALRATEPEVWINFARAYMRETGTAIWQEVNARVLSPVLDLFTEVLQKSLPAARRSDLIFILGMAIHVSAMAADPDEASIVGERLAVDRDAANLEAQLVDALTAAATRFA